MNARLPLFVGAFAASIAAHAQPTTAECPPTEPAAATAPISGADLCTARVLEFEPRITALGRSLCARTDPSASKAAEDRLARDFAPLVEECADALLASESAVTQSYLYSWLTGPSEGWGDSLTVRGTTIPASLRKYREAATSTSGWSPPSADDVPTWFEREGAYALAVEALLDGARARLAAPSSSWSLNTAKTKIDHYRRLGGVAEDDPRVRFLSQTYARLETPTTEAFPAELVETYVSTRPVRLTGAAGFYAEFCDAAAAKDDALTGALKLAWIAHLLANGPKELDKLVPAIDAARAHYADWSRAEPVFGADTTGPYMADLVMRTYFADDGNVAKPSAEMTRALADGVNGPLRARFGLPPVASADRNGDALAVVGSKFDSNDNLRVVFPGKCDLTSVKTVKDDGSSGEVLSGHEWDPRGIYDPESYRHNGDYPLSELVFREPAGAKTDKARSYDVSLTCRDVGVARRVRLTIPPRPDSTEPIDFILREDKPPYDGMLADGALEGIHISGTHTRDGGVVVAAYKKLGFKIVSRKKNVDLKARFFDLLGETKDGKPRVDYFVKDAHANGYAYDAGMLRVNKTGIEVVMEKKSPDGKTHRLTVLGNSRGEGDSSPGGHATIDYAHYFDTVSGRGDAALLVGNFSCWSVGKSAFEMDGIRATNVKYLPTDESATFYTEYFPEIVDEEITFILVGGLDKRQSYAQMSATSTIFDGEILLPSDEAFVSTMTDKIQSHRASNTGIPVRVSLVESRPAS